MTLYNINHFDTKNINPVTLLPVFGRPDVQNILLKMKNDMCIYSVGQTRKLARMT